MGEPNIKLQEAGIVKSPTQGKQTNKQTKTESGEERTIETQNSRARLHDLCSLQGTAVRSMQWNASPCEN